MLLLSPDFLSVPRFMLTPAPPSLRIVKCVAISELEVRVDASHPPPETDG